MGDSSATQNVSHPPKPILTLRVGITGHRPKPARFPSSAFDDVKRQLERVFEAIDTALSEQQRKHHRFYSNEPFRVRLVSGMAEGADQMAVRARPRTWGVEAVLPFPRDSFRKDFEKSAADETINAAPEFDAALAEADVVLELPEVDETTKRDLAYGRLGAFLVRQVDLLVAVWDGGPEEGIGGTTDVIRQALAAHVPVVWIISKHSGKPAAAHPRLIERIERDGETVAPDVDCTQGKLAAVIETIVSPPTHDNAEGGPEGAEEHGPSAASRLIGFMEETWPRATRAVLYDLLKRRAENSPLRLTIPVPEPETRSSEWDEFFQSAPRNAGLEGRLRSILLPRYIWADQLAVHFSNLYRSAYMFCYLLSAVVVCIALIGVFFHFTGEEWKRALWLKAALVLLELIFIALIVRKYRRGRALRWHERWLEYRALAEMLRDSLFLAYLAEYGRIQRTDILKSPASAWFLWYLRATVREIGLPTAELHGTYQYALLTAVHDQVIAGEKGQIEYHRHNAAVLRCVNTWLRGATDVCFGLTLAILIAFLAIFPFAIGLMQRFFESEPALILASLVTFSAAFFPALGAAIAGIRETGDFESFSNRSAQTVVALANLLDELKEAKVLVSIDDTGNVLFSTARIMTEDLAAWQSLYGGKRLNLPL
jgi:hypothetical protein